MNVEVKVRVHSALHSKLFDASSFSILQEEGFRDGLHSLAIRRLSSIQMVVNIVLRLLLLAESQSCLFMDISRQDQGYSEATSDWSAFEASVGWKVSAHRLFHRLCCLSMLKLRSDMIVYRGNLRKVGRSNTLSNLLLLPATLVEGWSST